MSHLLEEDSDTRSSEIGDYENECESIDTDSLHLEEMEEDETSGIVGLQCNPSERVIGGSIILQIDQTGHNRGLGHTFGLPILQSPFENLSHSNNNNDSAFGDIHVSSNLPSLPEDEQGHHHTASAATSLSEAASDSMSTRAVMGDTPSGVNTIPEEDDVDNSSQASMPDSDAERVRRIHNSIFRGLEHDLAELVRIREETIQFLENGAQDNNSSENVGFDDEIQSSNQNGDGFNGNNTPNFDDDNNNSERVPALSFHTAEERPEPVLIRERLTFPISSPYQTIGSRGSQVKLSRNTVDKNPNTLTFDGYSYTPIAKFDNAPPAKPGKPYVELGLMNCDEKAAAARKIFDKLQYGDPEDESACFVRRFWRETSTVVDNISQEDQLPVTVDAATLAQRSESLQATLEEAFGGLRLRLQQAQAEASAGLQAIRNENNGGDPGGEDGRNGGDSETSQLILGGENRDESSLTNNNQNNADSVAQSLAYYQSWDEETSILNNPLNYDIWNELEDSTDIGSTITTRINLAERRANASRTGRSLLNRSSPTSNNSLVRTTTVAVGTDDADGSANDGDLDDEVDGEILSYFRCHMANPRGRCQEGNDNDNNLERDFSPATMEFFDDIGVSEQLGRDIFDMLSISDEDVPPLTPVNNSVENTSQMPEPLYRRQRAPNSVDGDNHEGELDDDDDDLNIDFPCMDSGSDGDEEDEEDGNSNSVIPRIPLADVTSGSGCSLFAPNREDDCSTRVYFDENYLSFARASRESQEEQDEEDTP